MKVSRLIVIFISSIIFILPAMSQTTLKNSSNKVSAPAIVFDNESLTYDFGNLLSKQKSKMTISFKNDGNADLKILKHNASCGCTVLQLSQDVLKPGETSEIEVVFTAGIKGGPTQKYIYLETNDPKNLNVKITLKANINIDFVLEPSFISFGRISRDDLKKIRYSKLDGNDKTKYSITSISSSNPYIETKLVQADENYESTRVVVNLKNSIPLGPFKGSVKVKTDHPQHPELLLQVNAFILGHIKVKPARALFRIGVDNDIQITIANPKKKNFKILSASVVKKEIPFQKGNQSDIVFLAPELDDIGVTIGKTEQDGTCSVAVTFKRTLQENERVQGIIRFATDDPDQKEVDVPYFAFAPTNKDSNKKNDN